MKKYRFKKGSISIEAVKLIRENALQIVHWINRRNKNNISAKLFDEGIIILTREGETRVYYGDWLLRYGNGVFEFCKENKINDIFKSDDEEPATQQQPTPCGNGNEIHDLLIEDIRKRKELGKQKYGEPLRAFNGRNALVDAYQEILDLAVYLRQWIEEREEIIEDLISLIADACTDLDGNLDSRGMGSYTEALRTLEMLGIVEIIEIRSPNWIIAKWREK